MELKTTNIKGRDYVQVNERVRAFRTHSDFANMSIETNIVELSENRVLMVAKVLDQNGHVRSTGHAEELLTSHGVNSTSFIENCETSAVGRCLGFLGIGVDTSIASSEEVQDAIARQDDNERGEVPQADSGSKDKLDSQSWKEVKCPVGKYKGKLMGEVFKHDPSYLSWMVKNIEATSPTFRSALDSAAKELNDNGNQGFKLNG